MSAINAISMANYTIMANDSAFSMMQAANARVGMLSGLNGYNINFGSLEALHQADTQLQLDMLSNSLRYNMSKAILENLKEKNFDIIVSRAVADLSKISNYALPLLKKNGFFIAYKSKKSEEEILNAEKTLNKFNAKIIDIIEYALPMPEIYERKLICIKRGEN